MFYFIRFIYSYLTHANMSTCRILTPSDEILIPQYLGILNQGLEELSVFSNPSKIQETRRIYTPKYVRWNLPPDSEKRFIGHFEDTTLDGILIEGFDNLGQVRTTLNWVVAKQKRKGIGTQLIMDCIARAQHEKRDVVVLGVSKKNVQAIRLYERLGFIHGGDYDNGEMEVMGYPF